MSPQEIEAVAQRIVAAAALVEGDPEPVVESDAVEAARAVEAVLREVSGGSMPAAGPPEAEPAADEAWFAANPGRTARLRAHLPGDPRPHWAGAGQPLMSVVRYFPTSGAPSIEAIPAAAGAVVDTDAAVLAAVRSARGLR